MIWGRDAGWRLLLILQQPYFPLKKNVTRVKPMMVGEGVDENDEALEQTAHNSSSRGTSLERWNSLVRSISFYKSSVVGNYTNRETS
mmetsp:Transcript_11458/g.25161  ORF Transcript_11458/g.25161 Transcript_11458/m.25161 type:complete len:87 (+) Transcript_11458:470-730(+)